MLKTCTIGVIEIYNEETTVYKKKLELYITLQLDLDLKKLVFSKEVKERKKINKSEKKLPQRGDV